MDLIEAIDTRSSAGRLSEPGPTPEHLDLILNAARRAPDRQSAFSPRSLISSDQIDQRQRSAMPTA